MSSDRGRRALALGIVLLAPMTVTAADSHAMQPGLWEYTTRMEVPGAPFAMPPQTTQQCVTAAEVAQTALPETARDGQQGDCQVKNFKRSGATVSYDVVCAGAQPNTSQVRVTTAATTMESSTIMDMGGQKMTSRITGKRIGDCK